MTFTERLHLRDNWPLWVAITLFCLMLFCLCIFALSDSISRSNFDVCISDTFRVYQCDSLGLMCKSTFQTNSFANCDSFNDVPKQANLRIDDELQSLFVVLDDESFPVVPQAK